MRSLFDLKSLLLFVLLVFVTNGLSLALYDPNADDENAIDFNRDIRPILADKCFACHGPDKNKREADLRLDTELGLVGNGAQAGAVRPGDPENSPLIQRIESSDVHERMPPAEFGKEIEPAERALLRKWIDSGAKWSGHWAFQPRRKSPLPSTIDRFSRDAIDARVYGSMKQHGLEPSTPEAPETLARRVSFDLLGLPPDPALVKRLAADPSLKNYEAIVDELIASPHFGERLAVWWLDLVRYADSVGYHGDQPVKVSPFRDYVIRAFNSNKPFDQFTIEQIAGDLMPEPTNEQMVASGYNRLGMMSAEGGAQAKEYLSKYASERVRNLSGAWLGVTLGCCECHDHKYDAFTSREFYQLEAFFADIQEQGVYDAGRAKEPWGPEMQVPSAAQSQQLNALNEKIAITKKVLDTPTDALRNSQSEWEKTQVAWTILRPSKLQSSNGATLQLQPDGSILASGTSPAMDTYECSFDSVPTNIAALRIEVLPHDSLPNKGPGLRGQWQLRIERTGSVSSCRNVRRSSTN